MLMLMLMSRKLWHAREPSLEPSLEPKHRIFLSHSGAQKDFTWQLCVDLERVQHYPFFDRRDDSLPKGEKFPPLIIEAARQCRVAVLVLSDEFFTNSKWPMIELNEFVMAQGSSNPSLKILLLFFGITMEQFYEKKRRACWFKKWKKFACEDNRIDVEAWKEALSKIPGGINSMEYIGVAEGEVVFRKKVVDAICRLLPPDLKYDVSHVQSLRQLCEPIEKKLEEVEVSSKFKVQVVGLYGMGGVGKTTISRAICNQVYGDFGGKVCHVELGGNDLVELKKRVLRELTEVNSSILESDPGKLDGLLKERMLENKVFLVLDNVWDAQDEEALKYLHAGYHDGSMVLVTSRSLELLKRLGIAESNCMEMPNLEQMGAINVFLHYLGVSRESIVEKSDLELVKRCVMECYFSRGEKATPHWSKDKYAYHPLALKVLGLQLHGMAMKNWNEILKELKVVQDKFNMLKDKVHPVHSILRLGFDYLDNKQQDIFMDLALIWTSSLIRDYMAEDFYMKWEWLCILHSMSDKDMIANVKALQWKGLLDNVNYMTKLEYNIHDLYVEFAKAETQARPFEERHILLDMDGIDVPWELEMHPPYSIWTHLKRIIIYESKVKSLKDANLQYCKNVELLILAHCANLEEVNVTGMSNLRIVVVHRCKDLGKLKGLETLKKLLAFYWTWSYRPCHSAVIDLAISSTKLRVIRLRGIGEWSNGGTFPVDLSRCTNLQEVALSHRYNYPIWSMRSAQKLGQDMSNMDIDKCLPKSVLKLDLPFYRFLGSSPIIALAAFTNLQDLNLCYCEEIRDLMGLCELILLQKLNVGSTGISELLDDLWKLRHLQYLDVSNCKWLTSIYNIVGAAALRTVYACECGRLEVVPSDFSRLQHLEVLDLREAIKIFSLPQDYERLAGYPESGGILKVKVGKCWGLIEPLVQKLRGSEVSWVACEDGCNCKSESMALRFEARKSVDIAAYDWLKDVLGGIDGDNTPQTYLMDCEDHEAFGAVVINALCEHDDRGRTTNRLAAIVQELVTPSLRVTTMIDWWIVVATAPCTFKAMTKGMIMEPWRETFLHYRILVVLPRFLKLRETMIRLRGRPRTRILEDDNDEDECNNWFLETWLYKAIVAVLQEWRETLDDGSEQGIDLVRCDEGKKFVSTFLCELEAAKSEELHDDSILRLLCDTSLNAPLQQKLKGEGEGVLNLITRVGTWR